MEGVSVCIHVFLSLDFLEHPIYFTLGGCIAEHPAKCQVWSCLDELFLIKLEAAINHQGQDLSNQCGTGIYNVVNQ